MKIFSNLNKTVSYVAILSLLMSAFVGVMPAYAAPALSPVEIAPDYNGLTSSQPWYIFADATGLTDSSSATCEFQYTTDGTNWTPWLNGQWFPDTTDKGSCYSDPEPLPPVTGSVFNGRIRVGEGGVYSEGEIVRQIDSSAPLVTVNSPVNVTDTTVPHQISGTVNDPYAWITVVIGDTDGNYSYVGDPIAKPDGTWVLTVDTADAFPIGTYAMAVTANDRVGNSTTATGSYVVQSAPVADTIPPVITLNGPSVVNIPVGGSYTELGATWTDNVAPVAGNVDVVDITSTVNTAVVGQYTVTYKKMDAAGNAATPVFRTVNVIDVPAPATYTISFNTNGGSVISPITQTEGSAVDAPANPTKTGHTFNGWSPVVPTTMPSNNMTFTAQWLVNSYSITFDSNGGTAVAPLTQNFGTPVAVPSAPTKTGYTFTGWSPSVPPTMPAGNMSLTAQWALNSYKADFNVDGVITTVNTNFGGVIFTPLNPTKPGHTFTGWNPTVPTSMPASNQVFTAKWSANKYTVEFNVDGEATTLQVACNSVIPKPANPSKSGYKFAGWSIPIPASMPANNLEFVALWTPVPATEIVPQEVLETATTNFSALSSVDSGTQLSVVDPALTSVAEVLGSSTTKTSDDVKVTEATEATDNQSDNDSNDKESDSFFAATMNGVYNWVWVTIAAIALAIGGLWWYMARGRRE